MVREWTNKWKKAQHKDYNMNVLSSVCARIGSVSPNHDPDHVGSNPVAF